MSLFNQILTSLVLLTGTSHYSFATGGGDRPPQKRSRIDTQQSDSENTESEDSSGALEAQAAASSSSSTTSAAASSTSFTTSAVTSSSSSSSSTSGFAAASAVPSFQLVPGASSSVESEVEASGFLKRWGALISRQLATPPQTTHRFDVVTAFQLLPVRETVAASLSRDPHRDIEILRAQIRAQALTTASRESSVMPREVALVFLKRWEAYIRRRLANPQTTISFDVVTSLQQLPALHTIDSIKFAIIGSDINEPDPFVRSFRATALRKLALLVSRDFVVRLGMLFPERVRVIRRQLVQLRDQGRGASALRSSSLFSSQVLSEALLKEDGSNRVCAICHKPFAPKDVVRRLPCVHVFHKVCVDPWLDRNATCPFCSPKVFKKQQQQQQQ